MAGFFDDLENTTSPVGNSFFDGLEETELDKERTVGSTIKDVGISLAKGGVNAVQGVIGLADIPTGGRVGKGLESVGVKPDEWQQDLSGYYSPAQQAANQQVDNATGFVDTAKAMIQNPSTIAHGIVETLPSVAAGGVIGRGALAVGSRLAPKAVSALGKTGSAIAAGAVGEGAIGAGQTAEQIRSQTADDLLTDRQAGLATAAGLGTGIFGIVGGRLAKKFNFADVDTMVINGLNPAKKDGLKGVVKSIIGGGITEGVFEELPQTVQDTIFTNAALDKPLLEGVPESSAQAIILGGAMGGGANLLPGKDVGPVKTEAEIEIERRAGNILSQKDEEVTKSIQKLNEDLKVNQELLTDLDKLDQKARELNIAPADLARKVAYDNKTNQALLDKIKAEITKKEEIAKKEYEALSPEEKQVKDIENKLIAQRQAEAQKINSDLDTLTKREEIARKQYKDEKDPAKKALIAERAISLKKEKDALLDRQKELVENKSFAPYTTREDRQKYLEDLFGTVNVAQTGQEKPAEESAKVFQEDLSAKNIADYINHINSVKAEDRKQALDQLVVKVAQEKNVQKIADYTDYIKNNIGEFRWNEYVKQSNNANKKVSIQQTLDMITQESDPAVRQKLYNQMFQQPGVKSAWESAEVFLTQHFTEREKEVIENYWQEVKKELNRRNEEMTPGTEAFMRKKFFETQLDKIEGNVKQDAAASIEPNKNVVPSLAEQNKRQQMFQQIATELGDFAKTNPQAVTPEVPRNLPGGLPSSFKNEQPVGTVPQFQVGETQNYISNVTLADIQKVFPGQTITKSEDGTISVQFKNGKGLTINSIQSAVQGYISLAIETGQMSKNGKILGITVGNKILLDDNFADNKTLWHENKHVLDNLGLITETDDSALNKEFNKLRKAGKLKFALSTHKDPKQAMVENRANMFAQIMTNRDAYRNTGFGKVIQRVMDFFQQLLAFGKQTVSGLAREVESGKIYERQVGDQTISTTVPMAEQAAAKWHSALENAVAGFQQKVGTPDQWKGMIKGYPGIKQEELDWIGLDEWLDSQNGKVSKDDLVKFIAENNVRLEEVVKGEEKINNTFWEAATDREVIEAYKRYTGLSDADIRWISIDQMVSELELGDAERQTDSTKYSNYQLPGGKNYQELLITLPQTDNVANIQYQKYYGELSNKYNISDPIKLYMTATKEESDELNRLDKLARDFNNKNYNSSHWDEPNILTHIRFNERTDADGNRVLFLEEVQSDWHQEGRKEGYNEELTVAQREEISNKIHDLAIKAINLPEGKEYDDNYKEREKLLRLVNGENETPDAPFKKSWPLLAMKRMVRYAAENGFDKIAWTTGEQQFDRYPGGTEEDQAKRREGMIGFYDQMLPSMLNKEFNRGKWGNAKVEEIENNLLEDKQVTKEEALKAWDSGRMVFIGNEIAALRSDLEQYQGNIITTPMPAKQLSIPITNRMKSKALREGMPMFEVKDQANTNSKNFKAWFKNSKVIDNNGSPLIVYHSTTAKPFNVFKTDVETQNFSTKEIVTRKRGAWFTDDPNYLPRDLYAQNKFYLSLQNPLDMRELGEEATKKDIDNFYKSKGLNLTATHDWDGDTSPIFDEPKMRMEKLQQAGYDGVILKEQGGATSYIAFNPEQIKSIDNLGTWSSSNDNVYFEIREEASHKIPDDVYAQMFKERNSLVRTIGQTLRMRGHEIKQLIDKGLGSISTRLKNVDPMLRSEIRNLDFRTAQKIVTALRIAHPLLEKTKKMSPEDKFVWDAARRNSDEVKIKQIAEKYGMVADQEKLRGVLNQIRQDALDVGYDVGFIEEYWPRIIKDQEGFLQATKGISQRPVITDAIKKYADKLGMTVEKFEIEFPEQAADIASNTILGRNLGIGGPGNIQARVYDVVPPELNKYYMDSDAALMQYIYSMTKKIEARRFFGKVPERIANLKTEKKRKEVLLKETTNAVRREELSDDLLRIEQELDKYKLQRDYTENIGTYINDLRMSGRIQAEDEKVVRDILDARFHEHGTTGIVNAYKNMAYIDVMGSPISALTQIGDLAWAMYVGKVWTPRGLVNTFKNIGKATSGSFRNSKYLGGVYKTFGGSEITKEDLGIERIAQEFADGTTLGNAVSWVFKKVQLERIDSIGKETLINNAFDNYKVMASTEAGRTTLLKQLKPIFGTQSESVINDLLSGNPTDNVKMLLYHRLLDFQPVALSEMPEQYLKSGNGRVFYMLKTYTIKQFDVFRNEAWHKIKSGEKDQVIEGIGNMIKLVSLLTLANAGADELKDLLLGKEVKFEDHVIENFLTMGGASKYVRMQTTREGLGSGLAGQILPPFRFINSISKDLGQAYGDYVAGDTMNFDHARIVESIPIGGKLYYWNYGRGEDYKKSSNEQEFTKVGKEVKLFKRQLENVEDKRTFLNSNLDKFKQMKLHENFQASLNRIQAVINKLKDLEQTTNVRERLGQLQQQREMLLSRYFEVAAGM